MSNAQNDCDRVFLELQSILSDSWCKRHTPLQWCLSIQKNPIMQGAQDKIVSEHLSNIFLDILPLGPLPSPFLLGYLHHALSTRMISMVIFFQQIYRRVMQTTELIQQQEQENETLTMFDRPALFAEYIRLIQIFAPRLASISVSSNATKLMSGNEDETTDQEVREASRALVQCCLVLIHYLSNQYYRLQQQVNRQHQLLQQQQQNGDNDVPMDEGNPATIEISNETLAAIDSAQNVLSDLLCDEQTRLLIAFCEHFDADLWRTFQQTGVSVILNPYNSQYIPSFLHQCTVALFHRKATQYTTGGFHMSHRSEGLQSQWSQSHDKLCLKMFILDEITTCDLKRTDLNSTFERLERLRQSMDIDIPRFLFDFLYTTFWCLHTANEFVSNISDTNEKHIRLLEMHRFSLYKSFLLAKIPALIQKWLANVAPSPILEPIIKQLVPYPNVYMVIIPSQQPVQQTPVQEDLGDGILELGVPTQTTTDLLLELMLVLVRMGLIDEANIKKEIPQFTPLSNMEECENISFLTIYPLPPIPAALSITEERTQLQNGITDEDDGMDEDTFFIQAIENNHHIQGSLLQRYLEGIWSLTKSNSTPLKSIRFLSILCHNPNLLDLFHLHGMIPQLISHTLHFVRWVLGHKSDQQDQDNHSYFSIAFTVLYLIVERFEVIQCRSARDEFERLVAEACNGPPQENLVQHNEMNKLTEWFRQWFYDAVPAEHARVDGDDGIDGEGDELLAVLLEAQRNRAQQSTTDGTVPTSLDTLDESILAIRNKLSPVRILEISHYVTQQCIYAVAANKCKPVTVFSMLALFCEHFGNHIEVGISLSLRTCLHHIFFATQYHQFILQLIDQLMLCLSEQRKSQSQSGKFLNTGYSIGSSMLHNIIKRHVHLVNQNHYDVGRNPTVLDYEKMQQLMRDEYMIVRNPALHPSVQWQSPSCQTPPVIQYAGIVLLPLATNANSSSSSSFSLPSTSTTLSCLPYLSSYESLLCIHLDNFVKDEYNIGKSDSITFVRQFYGTFGVDHLTEVVLLHLHQTCGGKLQSVSIQQQQLTQQSQQQSPPITAHPSNFYRHHQAAYSSTAMRMAEVVAMVLSSVDCTSFDRIICYHLPQFVTHYVGSSAGGSTSTRLLLARATAELTALILTLCPSHQHKQINRPILDMIRKSVRKAQRIDQDDYMDGSDKLDYVDTITIYLIHLTERLVNVPVLVKEIFAEAEPNLMWDWAMILKNENKDKVAVQLFDLQTAVGRRMALSLVRQDKEQTEK